jgi:hypothetical protein
MTPGVNFTDILRAAFAPIFFCKKLHIQTVIQSVIQKNFAKHFYLKKLLVKCWPVKLTPAWQIGGGVFFGSWRK